MPSHYTQRELEERQRRRLAKSQQGPKPQQLNLFDVIPIAQEVKERIFEVNGHHWISRTNGRWEEHTQID